MPVSHKALSPFFQAMKTALGAHAATTKVSIAGGLNMQLLNIRDTRDIDVIVDTWGNAERPFIKHIDLRNQIVSLDKRFTANMEGNCGVKYSDPNTREITAIDIISPKLARFSPQGTILSHLADSLTEDDLPLASPEEIVKMKLLAAPGRFNANKAFQDLDDVKALVLNLGLTMAYKDEEEKATMKAALEEILPYYLKREWTAKVWKEKFGFA